MNSKEHEVIKGLDEVLKLSYITELINTTVLEAEEDLYNSKLPSITKTVPLKIFEDKLPNFINLCRVFILCANTESKIERHTNSFQRTMSWKGFGKTKVLTGNEWMLHESRASKDANLESRWLSVPSDTWHQPISGDKNWATVTFHTAGENEIIDEYQS